MVLNPNEAAAPHLQRGAVMYEQRNLDGAREAFAAALAVQPDLTPARFNLAVICRECEENETAWELFQQVIASGEIVAESYNNLGILAVRREQFDQATGHFRKAIQLKHQFPLAHFNLGTLLLRQGVWEEGLREYEWRWQTPTFTPIQCPQPRWDGQPMDGTLLLHTEQGIGDMLQYCRFIPMIRERVGRTIFLRPDHLDCMFPVEHWADEIMSPGEISLDSFQAVLPLMSAPLVLDVAFEDVARRENYLTPQPRQVDLGPSHVEGAQRKVGIIWCGSPTHVNDAFRSVTLSTFEPLLALPHIAFYSLQLEPKPEDVPVLARNASVLRDLSGLQSDLAEAAAIVQQLDLVITVDTAVLHLCGAMGLPVWGLISRRGDWRWLDNDFEQSPWYPSVRLFRQRKLNDWAELIGRVAESLRQLAE